MIKANIYYTLRSHYNRWIFRFLPAIELSRDDILADSKRFFLIIGWFCWQIQIMIISKQSIDENT